MKWICTMLPLILLAGAAAYGNDSTQVKPRPRKAPPLEENGGITLPAGFKAVVLADTVGRARHLVTTSTGDVYVMLSRQKNGHGVLRLRDNNKDGIADEISSFGNYSGTGITIRNGYLYTSSNKEIFRYKLNDKEEVINPDQPERIATGLIDRGTHNTKSLVLDNAGNIYVNIGAPSNACQVEDRKKGSPASDPCPLLDSVGGVWQFKADKLNQGYAEGVRFATGIRNIVGLDWNNTTNSLFAMQHGRDNLNSLFPEMYNEEESAELPAEELFQINKGDNFGWPYCYFDWQQDKKVLAPEYGGDKKKEGRCADMKKPAYAFPGHWAPNALMFYTGNQFPERYKNGAFIAFHGSWNRAPKPQAGYFVVFLPFKDGKPNGKYEIFADGFAGASREPSKATYRPCGLAQGPDGSLYISDDKKGRLWKVTYTKK